MAVNKGFGIDFKGFLDLAEEIDQLTDTDYLLKAAKQTLEKTKDYVNREIYKAMENSSFNFEKGEGYSQGKAMESFDEIAKMPVEVEGTTVTAYCGFDLEKAPEALILATYGAPHRGYDTKLQNAIKVKGKVKKEVERLQKEAFTNALDWAHIRDTI